MPDDDNFHAIDPGNEPRQVRRGGYGDEDRKRALLLDMLEREPERCLNSEQTLRLWALYCECRGQRR